MGPRLLQPARYLHQLSHQPLWRFSTVSNTNQPLLDAVPRRFNNLYLDLSTQTDDSFESKLDHSISKWDQDGIRALWAYTPSNKSHLIPKLIQVCIITHKLLHDQTYKTHTNTIQK